MHLHQANVNIYNVVDSFGKSKVENRQFQGTGNLWYIYKWCIYIINYLLDLTKDNKSNAAFSNELYQTESFWKEK